MNIFEVFKIITLFVLTFFSLFLFLNKTGIRKSNVLLAIVITIQALELLNATFYRFPLFWKNQYPEAFYTTEFTFFLWGPVIYLFFRTTTELTFEYSKKHLLHLLPAICHILFLIFRFHILPTSQKIILLHSSVFTPIEDGIIHGFKNLSVIIYLYFSYKILIQYIRTVHEKENHLIKGSIDWLRFLFIVFCIVEFIQILQFVDIETRIYNKIIYDIAGPLWFVIAVLLLFKALQNPDFFQYVPAEIKEQIKIQIVDEDVKLIAKKIEEIVLNEYMYRNPDLQLNDIAEKLEITTKKVSQVINLHFEKNFSDFINFYRIEEAKKLLLDPSYKKETVLSVGYDVGFNSKASFNRVFQKIANTTPSNYKKNVF